MFLFPPETRIFGKTKIINPIMLTRFRLTGLSVSLLFLSLISLAQPGTIPPEQRDQLRRQVATQPTQQMQMPRRDLLRETDPAFFATDEARRIGDQVLDYQRVTGGWPKNLDMARRLTDAERLLVLADKARTEDSTIDNGATTMQMAYLARLWQATRDERYRAGFLSAVEYLLSGQYENGGWPQVWPEMTGYQAHITYNDDAIVNTLELFRAIYSDQEPYGNGLADEALCERLRASFDKGIECILATQIYRDGQPTVWCQQHDRETLAPAPARAYELPSFCSAESAGIVRLLMSLPDPDARVKKAIHGAMRWFDTYKLTGLRVERSFAGGTRDTRLAEDPAAPPMWGRFYDLKWCEPYVCDRDGIARRRLEEIGPERRNGYSWYNSRPAELYPLYEAWAAKNDPRHRVKISLSTPGANQNGTIELFRRPVIDRSAFDVVVRPGESIQAAIEKAPEHPTAPFKILVLNGEYNEKVIIDRPNIILVGENRDATVLRYAELSSKRSITEYKGKPVGNGVIVLQEGADDCIISGLTVYNNYGTTVEETTAHQMAIYGRGTRTIVINCHVWADGNDALSLWAPEGEGMYYHADLDLRCRGVDFLCPRGWCYATRCSFYGDGKAMIWHDGRGNPAKKLVITNSSFDAASPTLLGRYHHDAQFYLLHCTMTEHVINGNIHYAYSDQVLDPCPWGLRTYYHNCIRQGGHSGWLRNNLSEAPGAPASYAVTATWTFDYQWDPEQRIRDLWDILAY